MIGVIIARFQTPYLHEGHKTLIATVKDKHAKVVIVLGVSPVLGSRRNPLDFPTREKMIKKEFPEVVVLPLPDHPLDARWSAALDMLLSNTFPGEGFTLYGGRDSFIEHYRGRNVTVELPQNGNHNATDLRKSFGQQVMDTEQFRAGVIYAYANTYLKVYPTVDIAIFRNNKTEILLGKKDTDQKWRLPGGFTDPTDESYEAAAVRELREECGELEVTPMTYEASFRVNDWRYRSEEDKIITLLFSADLVFGSPCAADDIAEVSWFTLEQLETMIEQKHTTEEHTPQFKKILNKYTVQIPGI